MTRTIRYTMAMADNDVPIGHMDIEIGKTGFPVRDDLFTSHRKLELSAVNGAPVTLHWDGKPWSVKVLSREEVH